MRSAQKWVLTVLLAALAAPVSAQIISTSIPKGLQGKTEKKWAFHAMASPLAKWSMNIFDETDTSILQAKAKPNSTILLAGEGVFTATDKVSVGIGGWFNKVGTASYDFESLDLGADTYLLGTLDIDTTLTEVHGSVFYQDIGVQVGMVHTATEFTGASLTAAQSPIGVPLSASMLKLVSDITSATMAGEKSSSTDTAAYLVYKKGSKGDRPWNVSAGLGMYNGESTVGSGFLAASVGVYKGLSVDASAWYIGEESSDSQLKKDLKGSNALARLTLGVGYTF